MWIHIYPNWNTNFNFKIGNKRSFFYETKAPISFILIRRMSWWCPIMKRKEIIMWIYVCHNWKKNFNSKKWWKEKLFLWNQKHQCHLSQWENWVYGVQSWKEWRLLCESVFVPINEWTLTLKNYGKRSFHMKAKHQYHLSNKENDFMVPNHEKKWDYYVNPCLPNRQMNLSSKNW